MKDNELKKISDEFNISLETLKNFEKITNSKPMNVNQMLKFIKKVKKKNVNK